MPVIDNRSALAVDNVLLATDFSEASEVAASYAVGLARHFSSEVTLAHVTDLSVSERYDGALLGLSADEIRHKDRDRVDRLLSDLSLSGVRVSSHVTESHRTAASIVSLAKETKADLIVMGTHGRHGLERAILGSVAEAVLRHATCPVLTVGPKVPKLTGPLAFSKIVFATALSSDVASKAAIALSFAQEGQAHIYLCHVMEQEGKDITETLSRQLNFESALQKLVPASAYDWCDPECVVTHGETWARILELAEKVRAELIVLGATPAASVATYFSSGVVGHVLTGAKCPVLTICGA